MNDCINAEIRDQLPDLVHDRLSAADRAGVLAHVEACADCRDELQLLHDAKAMFARGIPRVDVAYVVGALPKAPAPRETTSPRTSTVTRLEPTPRTRTWNDWRVAAAVTLLIAGGGSYAVMGSHRAGAEVDAGSAVTGPAVAAPAVAMTADSSPDFTALVVPDDDTPASVGSMDARLGDLNEDQLNTLLNDMDSLRAVPASEPDPVSIRIDGNTALEDM